MSDPVAEKSGFLKMYMSNHPDTLVAYAKWFAKVPENISSAEMSAIDSKSMTLTCKLKGGNEKKVVRIPIDPPLLGYEEVKPRLLSMKAEAQEGLGMIKAPQITTFRLPMGWGAPAGIILFYGPLLCIAYPDFSIHARTLSDAVGGFPTVLRVLQITAVAHVLESIYTVLLCKRHRTPFYVGTAYVLSTLLLGFPAWAALRKRIQAARIESVMKVE